MIESYADPLRLSMAYLPSVVVLPKAFEIGSHNGTRTHTSSFLRRVTPSIGLCGLTYYQAVFACINTDTKLLQLHAKVIQHRRK
jgi:hypothetical protein